MISDSEIRGAQEYLRDELSELYKEHPEANRFESKILVEIHHNPELTALEAYRRVFHKYCPTCLRKYT